MYLLDTTLVGEGFNAPAPRDLAARLSSLLQDATGTRWTIALSAAPGEPTLAEQGLNDFDLLRAVAAYNGGAGSLLRAAELLGPDPDTLLLIESLPAQETRNYVEKVVAGYWTYRKLFGAPNNTLDALANGSRTVDIRLDATTGGPVLAAATGA